MKFVLQFVVALVLVPLLDFLWIGLIMKNFYVEELGALGRTVGGEFKPMLAPAFVVYLMLALGLVVFVLPHTEGNTMQSLIYGALLGLVVYGVYDMTNMSILQNYSWKMSLVDMVWGTVLCGVSATIVDLVTQKFFPAI